MRALLVLAVALMSVWSHGFNALGGCVSVHLRFLQVLLPMFAQQTGSLVSGGTKVSGSFVHFLPSPYLQGAWSHVTSGLVIVSSDCLIFL